MLNNMLLTKIINNGAFLSDGYNKYSSTSKIICDSCNSEIPKNNCLLTYAEYNICMSCIATRNKQITITPVKSLRQLFESESNKFISINN